ncbi:MAG: hypothetical protein JRJ24_11155 [Deltaproteobacteria bacterium]|nr:hypothetical protein [Deltaproteobacteria bacterium]
MSTTNFLQHTPRVSLQKPISLAQPRDAYPYFVACRPEIETLLRAGHTMCRVWEAYRSASPPFPASYETFRRYCTKHGLAGLRKAPLAVTTSGSAPTETPRPTTPKPSVKAPASPKVWPRLAGKPREFVPSTED